MQEPMFPLIRRYLHWLHTRWPAGTVERLPEIRDDGTTAVPLAQLGAEVSGIDIARNLVAAGNLRAAALGLVNLKFQEGDACALTGVADKSFDLALTVFGAMFAPKPLDVAKELVRVTKPGGRIVMGNWIPNDPTSFVSQVLKISSAFTPPPPEGFISPMLGGVENHILERFAAAGVPKEQVTMTRDTFFFGLPGVSPEQLIGLFRDFYGPTMNAFEAAGKNGKTEELQRLLVNEAKAHNKAATGTHIPATFMRVTVPVCQSMAMWCSMSAASGEFSFEPKPLSDSVQKVPSGMRLIPERPCTAWPSKGIEMPVGRMPSMPGTLPRTSARWRSGVVYLAACSSEGGASAGGLM